MSAVEFGARGLRLDGRPVPLVAGEFNFWRHNPEHWPPILSEIKKLGVEIVCTFVCWDFHEVGRQRYVFDASENPMRDLEGLLEEIARQGMYAILRPGPIIDSEWPTRGPAPDVATLERTVPRFRERAAEWIAAIGPVIARHQASAGGPVLMLQLDNEVFYPHCTEASATEADSAFHIPYDEEVVLTDHDRWLEQQGEGAVSLPRATVPLSTLKAAQQIATFGFLSDQVGDYLQWVEQEFRRTGVDVPCYSNVKQSCAYLDERGLAKRLSGGMGGNNYMDRLRDEEEFLVAVWWNSLQRLNTEFPWAPEYWCGRWIEMEQDTTLFRPDHYRFCALTHIALGLRGLNYFTLVERDDWHYSPITGIGRVREELAAPVRDINALLGSLGPDERVADVALVWSLEDHDLTLGQRGFDWTELSSIWWEMDRPKEAGLWWETLRALVRADVDFVLVERSASDADRFSIVIDPLASAPAGGLAGSQPSAVLAAISKAGAGAAIRCSAEGTWTSLYRSVDGYRGFCVNRTNAVLTGELSWSGPAPSDPQWLVAPSATDGRTITLAPRTVAAFAFPAR